MSLILNGTTGISDVDGTAAAPAITGTDSNTGIFFGADIIGFAEGGVECARFNADSQLVAAAGTAALPVITTTGDVNTGIFFPAADTIAFSEGGVEAVRIDSSGNVGIGTSSPSAKLDVAGSAYVRGDSTDATFTSAGQLAIKRSSSDPVLSFHANAGSQIGNIQMQASGVCAITVAVAQPLAFNVNGSERARIDSSGNLLVGQSSTATPGSGNATAGAAISSGGRGFFSVSGSFSVFNRSTDDGGVIGINQDGTQEGTISVSGTTVSYNGGHLSRWAQMLTKPDLLKGTVLSNLDEMNVYTDADGNPVDNEQLNKVKVSDVEGDANVAGVFVNWTHDEQHDVDEINMAMTGDMIIRIAQGTTVARGDLLMSAGDGTAKPQGDDIVRSKTVAKVTSTHVTCTYADGSYCVPCVLMAC